MANQPHAIAVKAVIQNNAGETLLLRRSTASPHSPGEWDIPGGRIDPGEDPFTALSRECLEEAGIEVEIGNPIGVNYFTRDDGQIIVMIIFACSTTTERVLISDEHSEYKWVSTQRAQDYLRKEMNQYL